MPGPSGPPDPIAFVPAAVATPEIACTKCGACCVAPDITALDKPLGVPCVHLGPDDLCTIYDARPAVCRSYRADALCGDIAAPTRDERVRRYLAVFGLEAEAERVRAAAGCSMKAARSRLG